MKVAVEMDEDEIKKAIARWLSVEYGVAVDTTHLCLEVKSKQNYKSEWEKAACRVKAELRAEEK